MVWCVVWCVGRLPVVVPDFHEVEHHDDSGQTCLYHEHLTRWHGELPPEPENSHQHPFLHWHLLIPGLSMQDSAEQRPPSEGDSTGSSMIPILTTFPEVFQRDAFATFLANQAVSERTLMSTGTAHEIRASQSRLIANWCALLPDNPGFLKNGMEFNPVFERFNKRREFVLIDIGCAHLRC